MRTPGAVLLEAPPPTPEAGVIVAANRFASQKDEIAGDIAVLEEAGLLADVIDTPSASLPHTIEVFADRVEKGQTWVGLGGDTLMNAVLVAQYVSEQEGTSAVAGPRGGHSDYAYSVHGLHQGNFRRRLVETVTSPHVASVGLIAVELWHPGADTSEAPDRVIHAAGQVGIGASARVVEHFNDLDDRAAKEDSWLPGGAYDLRTMIRVARTNKPFPVTEVPEEPAPPEGAEISEPQSEPVEPLTAHEYTFVNMTRIGGRYYFRNTPYNQEIVSIEVGGRQWLLGQFVMRGARATAPSRWITGGIKGEAQAEPRTLKLGSDESSEDISIHYDGEDERLMPGTTVRVSLVPDAGRIRGPKLRRRYLGKQR